MVDPGCILEYFCRLTRVPAFAEDRYLPPSFLKNAAAWSNVAYVRLHQLESVTLL